MEVALNIFFVQFGLLATLSLLRMFFMAYADAEYDQKRAWLYRKLSVSD